VGGYTLTVVGGGVDLGGVGLFGLNGTQPYGDAKTWHAVQFGVGAGLYGAGLLYAQGAAGGVFGSAFVQAGYMLLRLGDTNADLVQKGIGVSLVGRLGAQESVAIARTIASQLDPLLGFELRLILPKMRHSGRLEYGYVGFVYMRVFGPALDLYSFGGGAVF
jgi:hypothetical protein